MVGGWQNNIGPEAAEPRPPAEPGWPSATDLAIEPLSQHIPFLVRHAGAGDPKAALQLLMLLDDPDPEVHDLVRWEIEHAVTPELWNWLIGFLADGRWGSKPLDLPAADSPAGRRLRRKIRRAFLTFPDAPAEPAKLEVLLKGLRAPRPAVQIVAIDLLALRSEKAALEELVELLFAAVLPVREHAALALGRLGGSAAVAALVRALAEEHDALSRYVTQALIQIGADAVPALIEALSDPDDQLRWHAAEALAEIVDARSIEALVGALEDPEIGVRWNAARGLARLGEPALVVLLRALETRPLSPFFARAARHAIRNAVLDEPRPRLQLVAEALLRPTASVEAPVRAAEALAELRRFGSGRLPSSNVGQPNG